MSIKEALKIAIHHMERGSVHEVNTGLRTLQVYNPGCISFECVSELKAALTDNREKES